MRAREVEEIIGKQTDRELSGHKRGTAWKRGETWGGREAKGGGLESITPL